jgi:hypothetical protein
MWDVCCEALPGAFVAGYLIAAFAGGMILVFICHKRKK